MAIRLADKVLCSISQKIRLFIGDGYNMNYFITIYSDMGDEKNGLVLINVKNYLDIVYKDGVKFVDDGLIQDKIIVNFSIDENNLEKCLLNEEFFYIKEINHNYDSYDSLDKFFRIYPDNKDKRTDYYKIIIHSLLQVRNCIDAVMSGIQRLL